MKVLFVGEGKHDIGNDHRSPQVELARGVVPILARKLCPVIDADSLAIRWTHIELLNVGAKKLDRDMRKAGYRVKAKRAILLSALKYHCSGTICVADGDTAPPDCLDALSEGLAEGRSLVGPSHLSACGVAYLSIEAWSLGVPEALAAELGVGVEDVRALYPAKGIEELSEQSGREEYLPKKLLQRIAQLSYRDADLEFREAVAERTEISSLEAACPEGFKRFADELRRAFPPIP